MFNIKLCILFPLKLSYVSIKQFYSISPSEVEFGNRIEKYYIHNLNTTQYIDLTDEKRQDGFSYPFINLIHSVLYGIYNKQ